MTDGQNKGVGIGGDRTRGACPVTRWRTVGLVVGIASVMYVIPLEWGVRPGFAWMIRSP